MHDDNVENIYLTIALKVFSKKMNACETWKIF